MNWSFADYLIAAILVIGFGTVLTYFFRRVRHTYRYVVVGVVLLLFVLLWAEMAVGIFGSPIAGE